MVLTLSSNWGVILLFFWFICFSALGLRMIVRRAKLVSRKDVLIILEGQLQSFLVFGLHGYSVHLPLPDVCLLRRTAALLGLVVVQRDRNGHHGYTRGVPVHEC